MNDERESWDLVAAAQAGDGDAYAALWSRYHDMIERYVAWRVTGRMLVEDITSETFLRGLRRIGSVSYQGRDVGAWFVTIARNLILDHHKLARTRRATLIDLTSYDGRWPVLWCDAPPDAGREVEHACSEDEIRRYVGRLNPEQREVIRLRFFEQLSCAETAKVMRRNEGAVKAMQHRAVRRLAELMARDGYDCRFAFTTGDTTQLRRAA